MFNFCLSLLYLKFPQTNLDKAIDAEAIFNLCKFELLFLLMLTNFNLIAKGVWGITLKNDEIPNRND